MLRNNSLPTKRWVTKRTFTARYARALLPPLQVQALPGGLALALDLSEAVARLQWRELLQGAGVRPGGV